MNKIFKVLLASFLITSFTSCDISADSQSNSDHHSSITKEEIHDMEQSNSEHHSSIPKEEINDMEQSNSEHYSSIRKEEENDMEQIKTNKVKEIGVNSDTYNKWIDAIKANDIELTIIENAIQWKYTTFSTWTKLINLDDLKEFIGETNKNLQFRVFNGNLESICPDVNTADWKI